MIADIARYESAGKLLTDNGKPDAVEMYAVAQDDIIGITSP